MEKLSEFILKKCL